MKLCQSVSMSGPSTTEKPMSPKIALTSSIVWLIGWMRPIGVERAGSETSIRSSARRASSSASSSAALRASMAPAISSFRLLSARPASRRASGSIPPSDFIRPVMRPFLAQRVDPRGVQRLQVGRRFHRSQQFVAQGIELAHRTGPERISGREARTRRPVGYSSAFCAASTTALKASASRTAMSASTLRSSSMPARFRPWMNWL